MRKGKSTDFPLEYGAPGRIRTRDPLVRSQVLYPTELPARGVELCTFLIEDAIALKNIFYGVFEYLFWISYFHGYQSFWIAAKTFAAILLTKNRGAI